MLKTSEQTSRIVIGWREWVGLPDLGLRLIKAKVDTGARTSSLHAFQVETFEKQGALYVRFRIHPHRSRKDLVVTCEAPVVDNRVVSDSSGRRERRYVIMSMLAIGAVRFPIEITLYNRETMSHRMLIGRSAMHQLVIDPGHAFLLGKPVLGKTKLAKPAPEKTPAGKARPAKATTKSESSAKTVKKKSGTRK
jgi:hypothetical protein